VRLDAELSPADTKILLEGVLIEGGFARCESVERIGKAEYRIVLKQGMKRQIRLMVKVVGHKVIDLKRVREGIISLGNLPEGEYRHLTKEEVERLKNK